MGGLCLALATDAIRVRKFDADRQDREVSLREAVVSKPSDRQLLWIDIPNTVDPNVLTSIGQRFEFDPLTSRALANPIERPEIAVHGAYFHLCVAAEPVPGENALTWLNVLCGRNVVITRHEGPLALLDELDRRIKADATLGEIEGADFVALMLESVVTSYYTAIDEVEQEIDKLDARSLRVGDRVDLLEDLVRLRRRIGRLRRVIVTHRSVFAALAGPDVRQVVEDPDAVADLQAVASRFESAVAAVDAGRDALLGSFDVYMSRTAQRTNEIVKVLTIATVLLLPGAMVAGLLGMNVVVPLNKDDPLSFWIVVGGVALLAVGILTVARLRRWI